VRREQRVIATIRCHMTPITRQEDRIADLRHRVGWQACVTKAGPQRLSGREAVGCCRNASRVERLCNRLKSRVHIAPLLVTRNDHIEGLPSRLTLGGRV
jgi:hypothetical protein